MDFTFNTKSPLPLDTVADHVVEVLSTSLSKADVSMLGSQVTDRSAVSAIRSPRCTIVDVLAIAGMGMGMELTDKVTPTGGTIVMSYGSVLPDKENSDEHAASLQRWSVKTPL